LGSTSDTEAILRTVEQVVAIVRRQAPEMLDHLWLYADSRDLAGSQRPDAVPGRDRTLSTARFEHPRALARAVRDPREGVEVSSEPPPKTEVDPLDRLGAQVVIDAIQVLDASDDVPEALWHYTDAAGALGILRDRALWATHAFFMNDASELRTAYPLLKEALDNARGRAPDNQLLRTLATVLQMLLERRPQDPDVYAMCFCGEGHLLSQWRAYGFSGGGYSLAFDGQALMTDAIRTFGLTLTQVIYEQARQQELAEEIVDRTVAAFARHVREHPDDGDKALWVTARSCSHVAQSYAYRIKHGAFAEEREWRLIYTRDPKGKLPPASRSFRVGARGLVPYVSMPVAPPVVGPPGRVRLDLGLADLHLREVRVGPTAHPEIAALAMRCLLDHVDLGPIEVTSSAIPLRA
jgi:hypothetical protein